MDDIKSNKIKPLNINNHQTLESLTWTYKKDILFDLARLYKVQLDDPEGKEKNYNEDGIVDNKKVVELDKSISRPNAVINFIKRKNQINKMFKEQGITYFENLWKTHLSDKAYEFCKDMYNKYDIIILADSKILDYFSSALGTVYNGSSLGKFSIVRDWSSVEKRPGRIKHEGIHSKQWWITKRIISLQDLLKRKNELTGLVPWAMDYATDNQVSDWETYLNQYKNDPMSDIKPYEFKRYKNKENRFDAIKKHMQTDIDEAKQDIEILKQKMTDIVSGKLILKTNNEYIFTRQERLANLSYLLQQKEKDLQTMEKLQANHENTQDWHQFITFGEQDGYKYQETPEKRQTNFQSDESLKKHVAIDMFITHYWDKKDNYKKWVEMYFIHKDKLDNVIEKYLKNKDKKELKSEMKKIFKEIDKIT